MTDKIEVNTIFGKLFAEKSGDPNYPGIVICIEQKDEDGTFDKQLAVVECTPDTPKNGTHSLRLLVWNSDSTEDYTNDFTFIEGEADAEDENMVWRKYLQYLRDWSEAHAEMGFYKMTPACFDEWYCSEYQDECI